MIFVLILLGHMPFDQQKKPGKDPTSPQGGHHNNKPQEKLVASISERSKSTAFPLLHSNNHNKTYFELHLSFISSSNCLNFTVKQTI